MQQYWQISTYQISMFITDQSTHPPTPARAGSTALLPSVRSPSRRGQDWGEAKATGTEGAPRPGPARRNPKPSC